MDPFSLALGVLTVIQTTASAVQTLHDFTKTVQNKPEEVENLLRETNSLYSVLRRINEALKDPKIAAYVSKNPEVEKDLASLKEPLVHCDKRIGELLVKLDKSTDSGSHGDRVIKSLRWYFVKDDVIATRNSLAQTREVANFAFSGLNFIENLRKNAEQDSTTEPPKPTPSPAPLASTLEELQQQGAALRKAAQDGENRIISLLLDAKVPIESKDQEGRTALSHAAEYGNISTINLLIAHGANVNAVSNPIKSTNRFDEAKGKRTALHWAAAGGHILVAEALLDAGAKIEAGSTSGRTPVQEAAIAKHPKTVDALLNRGADINARTYRGWTMLHTAANTGNLDLAALLLALGADVDPVYEGTWHGEGKGDTGTHRRPLHYAVKASRRPKPVATAMVEMLVDGGASLGAQDSFGATAVHYAVRVGWKEVVEVLVRRARTGDLEVRDGEGRTALMRAVEKGDRDIVDVLAGSAREKPGSGHPTMPAEATFP